MKGKSPLEKLSDEELAGDLELTQYLWQEAWDATSDVSLTSHERQEWRKRARNLAQTKGRLHREYQRRQKEKVEVS